MSDYALFKGGSDHCGPCQECVANGKYVSMAGTWEGDVLIYRCENGHEMPTVYDSFDRAEGEPSGGNLQYGSALEDEK